MMKRIFQAVVTLALVAGSAQAELVAYWSFDSDASDATGAHGGTLMNGASISTGNAGFGGGEALSLSGGAGLAGAQHMSSSNPTAFDFDTDFTWHAYVKTTTNNGGIFGRAPAASIHNQGSKSLFLGGANVQWDTGWVGAPSSNVAVTDDNWHQIIVTFSAATDQLDIFVDPTVGAATGQYSGIHDVNRFDESLTHNSGEAETAFFIGLVSDNFRNTGFVGLIDEAAVFDTALSGADLNQLILQGPASFLNPVGFTVFTGFLDDNIGIPGNWDNGLPTNDGTNPGIVTDGFPNLSGDPNGKQITFNGNSGYDGAGFNSSDSVFSVIFSGSGDSDFDSRLLVNAGQQFVWASSGTATAETLGSEGNLTVSQGILRQTGLVNGLPLSIGQGTLTLLGGRIESLGSFASIGDTVSVNQMAGAFVSSGELRLGQGAPGISSTWTLSGGEVTAENLQFGTSYAIDFPAGSSGVLNIRNSARDIAAMQGFINSGNITTGAPLGLSVSVVSIAGVDYTQVKIASPGNAPVTWDAAQNITGPGDIITTGTLLAAVNADNGADVVVDPGGLNMTFTPDDTMFQTRNPFSTTFAPSSGDAGFDAIMERADWDIPDPNGTDVVISGLTPGESYAIQFFVSDTRTCCNTRSMEITGGGNTAVVYMGDVAGTPNPAQFVVGRFVAEAPTQTFNVNGTHETNGNLAHPQLNAYVLRTDVPSTPLRITSISYDPSITTTTLIWDSIPNHRYKIQAVVNLGEEWFDLEDNRLSNGTQTTYSETNVPATPTKRFYRVIDQGVSPPN